MVVLVSDIGGVVVLVGVEVYVAIGSVGEDGDVLVEAVGVLVLQTLGVGGRIVSFWS